MFIFILIFVHELGHFETARVFKFEVDKIYLYPTGGISKFTGRINVSWYKDLLVRRDRKQYIYECNDIPIGQVRLHIEGEIAEIDYSICSSKRGMGHGKNMLQLLYNQVIKDLPDVKKLVGKVKMDNVASQKAFLDIGYTENYKVFEKVIESQIE